MAIAGAYPEHFVFGVRTLERLGVSAVMIEDKIGLKRNSLFGEKSGQLQDLHRGIRRDKISKPASGLW